MIQQKKIEVDIAIDLETLSTHQNAVVLSAGFAAFTKQGGLVGTFYIEFDKQEQLIKGRHRSESTVKWWSEQSPEAQAVVHAPGADVRDALFAINQFFGRFDSNNYEISGVWGYGSDFDLAILKSLYEDFDSLVPWEYKQARCARTLVAIVGPKCKAPEVGMKHHALEDAIWLADTIRRALMPQLF